VSRDAHEQHANSEFATSVRALMLRILLLVAVPAAAILGYWLHAAPLLVFIVGAIAIAALADWIRRATEQLAAHAGPAIGGLLAVSFGSAAELVLAIFVLLDGKPEVVRAQLTGSIMGTSLLGLGLAILAGGLSREKQSFKRERAGLLSSMLMLVMIALLLPAVFDLSGHALGSQTLAATDEQLSLGVSIVLLALYAGNLVYTLVTHRGVFETKGEEEAEWSLPLCLGVLIGATILVAFEAELVSSALEHVSQTLGLSPIFLGVVVLALIGTSSDLFAAIAFAREDRMGLVMSICIGSAIQVALVLAPLLVLISWALGHPMTLVFHRPLDLFAIAGTAFIVNAIAADGETTWFEGLLLVGVYSLLALAFFFS